MIFLDSPHWNRELGVCTKHMLPSVPCPQCIAKKDPDMEEQKTGLDSYEWDLEEVENGQK